MLKLFSLLILLLMFIIQTVNAQDSGVFCADLTDADCEIINISDNLMGEIETFAFDFEISLQIDAKEIMPNSDNIDFALVGSGELAVNDDSDNIFEEIDIQTSIEIVWPAEILLLEPNLPEISFDIIITDGFFYMDVAPFMESNYPFWMGIDMASYDSIGYSDFTSQRDASSTSTQENNYTTLTRLSDKIVQGQNVAVFTMSANLGEMLLGTELSDEDLGLAAEMLAEEGLHIDPEEFFDIIIPMFEGSVIKLTRWIGLEDYYLHHGELYFNIALNTNDMADMMGEPYYISPDEPESIEFVFAGYINIYDFNEPVDVEAPDNPYIIDPEDLGY
jgi:hypothetical protein